MATRGGSSNTPFFSRNYGGYTEDQWKFFEDHLADVHGKVILDPMAGQAYSLSQLSWRGYSVALGDINPAPLLLAMMRSTRLLKRAEEIREVMLGRISLLRRYERAWAVEYIDDWISPSMLVYCGINNE
jgi:hypothetical protein